MSRSTQKNKPVLAFVSDSVYPYNKGGKEVRLYELTRRLAAAGFEVHVFTMKWWEGAPDRVEEGVHLHAISRLYQLYAGERRSIAQGLLFGLACLKLITKRFDRIDVDHMPYFPLYSVWLVTRLRRKPMSATWHEVWGRTYWQSYLGGISGLIAWAIERTSVLLPERIFAVSPMTGNRLRSMLRYRGPITVIPNGVDAELLEALPPANGGATIMYAGRLLSHKNVGVLLQAVAELQARGRDVTCLIIGDGPERAALQTQARRLRLGRTVRFKKFLPDHARVFSLMKGSGVFVLPSTREGFGISLLEANACGVPVLTVDHPDNAACDLVRRGRTGLISPLDPVAMADAIEKILATSFDRRLITDHARRYHWTNAARRLGREIVR